MSFFSFCCGEGEEEAKFGAVAVGSRPCSTMIRMRRRRRVSPFVLQLLNSSTSVYSASRQDPSEYDWDDQESSEINVYKKRIAQREDNVSLLNKAKKIRGAIFSKPVDLRKCDDFEPPIFSKSEAQYKFLQDTLKDSFIFLDLDEAEGRIFIQAMEQEQIDQKGTRIIQQGDVGDFFYIVESGTVAFLDGDKQVGTSGSGSYFGELALLYDCARAVSCDTASDHVALWKVDQYIFRHLLVRHAHRHYQKMADLMRKISIFKDLDDSMLARFTNAMTPVHWEQGDRIVQKGAEGTVFYIIQEGKVKIHDIGLGDSQFEDQILGPGGWFGERALLTGEPRAANATAMTPVTTMAMDRETFETSIGALQGLLEREMRKQFLKGLPIFAQSSGVTDPEFDRLANLMQEVCYRKGDKLAEAGKPYEQNLWIIRHGQLLVYSEKTEKIWNLKSGDHFGDKSIRGDPDHISSHNAVCEENVTTWVLSRKAIESVIGDIDRLAQSLSPFSKSRQVKPIRLGDLKKRRVLGQGAFGRVWLVSHNLEADTGYALKEIGKQKLLDSGQEKSVLREKELLYVLRHPFILHLVSSFQDEHNLYLLLPLIPGGELYSLLQKQKQRHAGLPNKKASFYAACVVEGLGHFHQRRIAYRDLKLEVSELPLISSVQVTLF